MLILQEPHLFYLGSMLAVAAVIGGAYFSAAGKFVRREGIRIFSVLLLLALALSNPVWQAAGPTDSTRREINFLVDSSRSMFPLSEQMQSSLIAALPSDAQCATFGAQVDQQSCSAAIRAVPDATRTNLAKALGNLSGDVALLSDGRENLESAEQLLTTAKPRVRIFPILPDIDTAAERAAIDQVLAPPFVRARARFEISVSLKQLSTPLNGAKIRFTRSTSGAVTEQTILSDDSQQGAQRISAEFEPAEQFRGFEEFKIELVDARSTVLDQRVVMIGQNTEREILLVSQEVRVAEPLRTLLEEQGFRVVVAERPFVADRPLEDFRAVVLVNTARSALGASGEAAIIQYVQQGGSFVMTGGSRSYGLGGYRGSKLEDLLPVEILPPETAQRRLSVAVGLVLDKSGSMAQGERLDGAKAAARSVVDNLKDEDSIAVIGFDDVPFVVLRAAPVGQVRQIAAERISRLFPAGRTNLIPALDEARRMLTKVDAGRKHVIVMTDGRLPDESDFYFEMLRQMRLVGITVSTVLLGGDNDYRFLKQMAETGGGGFYQTNDPRMLPRIFLQDVKVSVNAPPPVSGSLEVRPVKPVSVTFSEYPDVASVAPSKMKEVGRLELGAVDPAVSREQKPLLASRSIGGGRVFTFLADVYGEQTERWFRWSQHGEFWRQLLSGEAAADEAGDARSPTLEMAVEQRGEYAALAITLYQTPPKVTPEWRIVGPDGGEVSERQVREIAPGRYRVLVRTAVAGRYTVRVGEWLPEVAFKVQEEDFKERVRQSVDEIHLMRLAELTGGQVIRSGSLSQLRELGRPIAEAPEVTSLRWVALLAAFLLQLAGMLFRDRA